MKNDFELALVQIAAEKGLRVDDVLEAVRAGVESAYHDMPGAAEDIEAQVGKEGTFTVYANRTVVDEVSDDATEISLEAARKIDGSAKLAEIVQIDITPAGFGRIAAQKARQTLFQTLREAERSLVYDRYSDHVGELVVGRVTRIDNRGAILEFGRAEGILPPNEQTPTERYRPGQRIRVYLVSLNDTGRGPLLRVSRRHPDFVRRLFEREIPEVANGTVEIVTIARDAGVRSKAVVLSNQDGLDPVGSCVGVRGVRIQNIVRDLVPEKVEIIEYHSDPRAFVANALSPAKVLDVSVDVEENLADVLVSPEMVSLAIGKEGQNTRLAARLTGWRINIRDASAPDRLHVEATPGVEEMLDTLGVSADDAEVENDELQVAFDAPDTANRDPS
ncbi:MAG: transcription termination factor NusA [Chloroflexi bacterium]|nr:transcription termination factor NusA [Chloroflexota bacterium]MCY3937776.1 transcription termination factor NusA [Chloroflexota bacterium]